MSKRYTILLWNRQFEGNAEFIVLDNENKKQTYFKPETDSYNLNWTNEDLADKVPTNKWESFEEESVDDLSEIVF